MEMEREGHAKLRSFVKAIILSDFWHSEVTYLESLPVLNINAIQTPAGLFGDECKAVRRTLRETGLA